MILPYLSISRPLHFNTLTSALLASPLFPYISIYICVMNRFLERGQIATETCFKLVLLLFQQFVTAVISITMFRTGISVGYRIMNQRLCELHVYSSNDYTLTST